MIEEQAVVIDKNSENITVETVIKSACSGCQQVDNCGSGQVSKAFPAKKLTLQLTTKLPVNIGDVVVLGLNEKHLLSSAWQVYIWPLIGLILFSLLGQWLLAEQIIAHELLAIFIAVVGGFLGFKCAQHQQISGERCQTLLPQVLRVENQTISIVNIP